MSPSASRSRRLRRGGRLTALVALAAGALLPAGAADAAPINPPSYRIIAPVLSIVAPVESLDGSVATARVGTKEQITLAADVLFAFNRASLTPAAAAKLSGVAARLRTAPAGSAVRIDGYTDAKGSPPYNLALSERRARAVAAALGKLVPAGSLRLVAAGYGEAHPIAANTTRTGADNPAGRARNRRVTITFG